MLLYELLYFKLHFTSLSHTLNLVGHTLVISLPHCCFLPVDLNAFTSVLLPDQTISWQSSSKTALVLDVVCCSPTPRS